VKKQTKFPDGHLDRAHVVLECNGQASEDLVPKAIAESWKRCLALGLQPQRLVAVEAHALRQEQERVALLRRLVLAEMENLYQQIAGTNYMIAFAGADGMLLDTICDPTFRETARASAIRPGTMWTEAQCGTNALGTAGFIGQALTVHGGEHFFGSHSGLTCTAVPLYGADGQLAGVLDASSDCRSRQQHTQALVSMAAAQIENGMFREAHHADVIVAFHSRGEYLHTLSAGLLVVTQDGVILSLNAHARFLLQGLPAAPGRRFEEIYRTRLTDLLLGARKGERQRLEDRIGSVFAAKVEALLPAQPLAMPGLFRSTHGPTDFVAEDSAVQSVLRR